MKTRPHSRIFPALLLMAGILLGLGSCQEATEEGKLSFGMELSESDLAKAAGQTDVKVVAALITLTDAGGMPVLEKEYLELITFGSSYVTKSLKLPVGEYLLEEFMLISADGQAIWATPRAGSKLAHLVRQALPMPVSIHPGETTSVDLQVVPVASHHPADFGYAEFKVELIERFCLQVYFNCDIPYYGNDTTPQVAGAGVPIFQPLIRFVLGNRVVEEALMPGLNRFNLPVVNGHYGIMAFDYRGENIFEQRFGMDELQQFSCRMNAEALMIGCGSHPKLVITPEDLREPSIRQGLFGQVLLPIDGPGGLPPGMADSSGHADTWPVIFDLHIYEGAFVDSLLVMGPVDCHIPFDWVWQAPLAIVRSNSAGIFQLPLEEGMYSYLVKTEHGYYVDAEVSSRRPGQFHIHPQEVTELYIQLMGCGIW